MKKNTKIFCIICLVSISILILILLRYNYVEKFQNTNDNNFKNTNIYVLYIPKREKYIRDTMNKLNFNAEYIEGPNKDNIDINKLKKNGIIKKDKNLQKGAVACSLGHQEILNKFLKTNKKYALIFEDDIKIDDYHDTSKKIINLINNIPLDADIVYLGYCRETCNNKYNDYFNNSIRPRCTHCYVVSKIGAKKIINNLGEMELPLDNYYVKLLDNKILKSYSANNNYFQLQQNRTELGSIIQDNDKMGEHKACI